MKMPTSGKNPRKPAATSISGPQWQKSSFSMGATNCVEVARLDDSYGVRDSKNKSGPVLRFAPDEWGIFIGRVRNGELDQDAFPA